MTDQTTHDVTDDDRRLARKWAESIESATNSGEPTTNPWSDLIRAAVRVILDAVPTPPRPTLADMTEEERAACQWMQCDAGPAGRRGVITNAEDWHVYVVDKETGGHSNYSPDLVVPRPDLPRLEWPGGKKPVPALPDGWRLADHREYGRVIVTRPEPDDDGEVAIAFSFPGKITRAYLDWCDPAELTYLDQEDDQ